MHELEKHQLACKEKSLLKTGNFLKVEIEVLKSQLKENCRKVVETMKKERKKERKKKAVETELEDIATESA